MADAAIGQNILQDIRDEARRHEQARQMSHAEIVELAKTDAARAEKMQQFDRMQQGIENHIAKVGTHQAEKAAKTLKEMEILSVVAFLF